MSRLGVRLRTILRALASTTRPRGRPGDPVRRLLVAHYLLLGDTILLAPLLKALAARHPTAERVVLARPAVAALFDGRPYGAVVLPFDRRDAASHRVVMDSGPYDLALVPDDNRYAWLARAAGAKRVVGFANDRPSWKNWMLDRTVPYPSEPSAWADLVARQLHDDDGTRVDPAPFVRGEWPAPAAMPFDRPAMPYAVLHVGASTPLKAWPATRWREIADRLAADGLCIVWSGGAAERAVLDAIARRDGETDLVGRLDLPQLWRLLDEAALLVCPDTGIAHLARVVGVPTVALFGPGSRVIHGAGAFWPARPSTRSPSTTSRAATSASCIAATCRGCAVAVDATIPRSSRPAAATPSACSRPLCMEGIPATAVMHALHDRRRR